jgi:hypothetical protein
MKTDMSPKTKFALLVTLIGYNKLQHYFADKNKTTTIFFRRTVFSAHYSCELRVRLF